MTGEHPSSDDSIIFADSFSTSRRSTSASTSTSFPGAGTGQALSNYNYDRRSLSGEDTSGFGGASGESYGTNANGGAGSRPAQGKGKEKEKWLSQVIEIESSDGEVLVVNKVSRPGPPPKRTHSAPTPSSDDLPDFRTARNGSIGVPSGMGGAQRSFSMSALGSKSGQAATGYGQPLQKHLATTNVLGRDGEGSKDKGKGKEIVPMEVESEEDPYDIMMAKRKKQAKPKKRKSDEVDSTDEGSSPRRSQSKGKKAPKVTEEEKETKKQRAADERAAKIAAKQQEIANKKEVAALNNLRVRGDTTKEITCHVAGTAFRPASEDDEASGGGPANSKKGKGKAKKVTSSWIGITETLRERMKQEHSCTVENPQSVAYDFGAEGTMMWTRMVDKKWDDVKKQFLALGRGNEILVEEDTRLVFMTAFELSTHIADKKLLTHFTQLQSRLPSQIQLIVMIQGLGKLFKSIANAHNAAYTADVRDELGGEGGGATAKPRTVGIGERQPDKDTIEYELTKIQIAFKCFIIHVEKDDEAVDWIEQLSMDIAQKPYQRLKQSHIVKLGTADEKIVSGKDLQDTYIKMLSCLKGVTEHVAKSIVRDYPTLRSLYQGWEDLDTEKEKKEMLVGITKRNNVNGTATNRAIGKSTSEYIYKILTSTDPDMFTN